MNQRNGILFVGDSENLLASVNGLRGASQEPWDLVAVPRGSEALKFLGVRPFDVLVADLQAPGGEGLDVLRAAADLSPDTIRIALSGPADHRLVMDSAQLIHQCLLKPCSPDTVRSAVARACALRAALARAPLHPLIAQMNALPPLPELYFELLGELRTPEASLEKVADMISRDLSLTAKILALVNSAYFGLRSKISSPGLAVRLLGLQRTRSVVISLYVFSLFDQSELRGFNMTELWDHSLKVGSLAQAIARSETRDSEFVDRSYTAGLLHDAGKLVLAMHCQEDYGTLCAGGAKEGIPVHQLEDATLKANHALVGSLLLGLWGLPESIVDAVAYHHHPACGVYRTFTPAAAVHVADAFVYELDDRERTGLAVRLDREFMSQLGLSRRLNDWRPVCAAMLGAKNKERAV